MTIDRDAINRRTLVIDDNVNIHEDFRKLLSPPIESVALDYARTALFGEGLAQNVSQRTTDIRAFNQRLQE